MSFKEIIAKHGIWALAFGYFACYVPYSFMVKALSSGLWPSLDGRNLAGLSILPVTATASAVGMLIFITAMGWWRYAAQGRVLGFPVRHPTRWTFFSGLCTALIIGTTTLAYTFDGISIVFAMLLMRGGVLVIAPIVDAYAKRRVRWFSWMGLMCAMAALLLGLSDVDGYEIQLAGLLNIVVYLASYFIRLRLMSLLAKSEQSTANRRYFVEEQMVAAPALIVMLAIAAFVGQGEIMLTIREGFTEYWGAPYLVPLLSVGLLSQGTGVFGSLIFLDRRENSYCVPVNRSSSILAGVAASYLLMIFPGQFSPRPSQLIAAFVILVGILFLTIPPQRAERKLRRQQK